MQEAIDRGDFKRVGPNAQWVPHVQKCLHTAGEIASAMAYLHSKDILHADLNGNNVLMHRSTRTARPSWPRYGVSPLSRVANDKG